MKGFMIKDIKLLLGQQKFFLIILLVGFMTIVSGMEASFFVGYITFMFAMFSLTTLTYDEYDQGMEFLLTLPITRKNYVTEKYIFSVVAAAIGTIFGMLVYLAVHLVRGELTFSMLVELGTISVAEWFITIVMIAVTIPFVLKFGAERGRLVMLSVIICVFLLIYGCYQVLSAIWGAGKITLFIDTYWSLLAAIGVVLILLGLIGSYVGSIRCLSRKEF